jgi:threonine/homoserine/homoserine lactone efflux protein
VPVGAIAALIVSLTARTSFKVGVAAALGVATADGLYALLAVLGGAALARLIAPISGPLHWLAAAVLITIAVRTARSALRRYGEATTSREPDGRMGTSSGAYLALLGLTLLNPATVVYFAALVLGSQSGGPSSAPHRLVFVLAAFAASASWQLLIATGGSLLGRLLTGPRGRLTTALVSSAVIASLALLLLLLHRPR